MAMEKQGEAADKVMFMGKNPLKNSLFLTVGLSDYEMLLCEPLHSTLKTFLMLVQDFFWGGDGKPCPLGVALQVRKNGKF